MRWNNKGHQFDLEAETILTKFGDRKICIYGAGLYGSELHRVLKKYDRFSCFLDADVSKQTNGVEGEKVNNPDTYLEKCDDIIVICASQKNGQEIKDILIRKKKVYLEDFFFMQEFDEYYWPIVAAYFYKSSYVPLAQIVLTNRCSLRCEKCAHGCQTLVGKEDLEVQEVKKTLDLFFGTIDYIRKFDLIGGEPLLYKDLPEVMEYIGKNHIQKIGCLEITTNGTILPSEKLLNISQKVGAVINVSDYSKNVQLALTQREPLVECLEKYGVKYRITEGQVWVDYGFDRGHCDKLSEKELMELYENCKTPCREIRGNQFYYCVAGRTSAQAFQFDYDTEEFLDFNHLGEDNPKIILEFNLGYSKKGYLEACKRCLGGFRINENIVPVAVQKQ